MADNLTRAQRTYNMSRIRSSGNETTEQKLVAYLRRSKISGWRRNSTLVGKPDFTFSRERVVIFVDGCFWHKCPRCFQQPKSNNAYWTIKIRGNVKRDRRITLQLQKSGWKVVRLWEHTLANRPARAIRSIKMALGSKDSR